MHTLMKILLKHCKLWVFKPPALTATVVHVKLFKKLVVATSTLLPTLGGFATCFLKDESISISNFFYSEITEIPAIINM